MAISVTGQGTRDQVALMPQQCSGAATRAARPGAHGTAEINHGEDGGAAKVKIMLRQRRVQTP
jgi:hypothetical protein